MTSLSTAIAASSLRVVCVGYYEHELLNPNLNVGPTGLAAQQRILNYVESKAPDVMTFACSGHYSSWLYKPKNKELHPDSVEVIGSWLGDCVMDAVAASLGEGIKVLLDPKYVIAHWEQTMSDDEKIGMALRVLERKHSSCRYTHQIADGVLLLNPDGVASSRIVDRQYT